MSIHILERFIGTQKEGVRGPLSILFLYDVECRLLCTYTEETSSTAPVTVTLPLQHTPLPRYQKAYLYKGDFLNYHVQVFYSFIQQCSSDSTVSEDAGFEPRTIAMFITLAVRRSNHSPLDLIHIQYKKQK